MITRNAFRELVEDKLVASVRVVPVPLENEWCIDVIVRRRFEAGSSTETLATPGDSPFTPDELMIFDSVDAAAGFLRASGVTSFTVDMDDALPPTRARTDSVHYLARREAVADARTTQVA